jgi:hypothetical protein
MIHLKKYNEMFRFRSKSNIENANTLKRIQLLFNEDNLKCFKDPKIFYTKSQPCSYYYEHIESNPDDDDIFIIQPIITMIGVRYIAIYNGEVLEYVNKLSEEIYNIFNSTDIKNDQENFMNFYEILDMDIEYFEREEEEEEEEEQEEQEEDNEF